MEDNNDVYADLLRRIASDENRIRAFARRLLPDWEAVDDVMQESYLVAWKKFDGFAGENFFGWMCTIVRFESLKYRRKHARSRLVFDEDLMSLLADERHSDPSFSEQMEALSRCMKALEPNQLHTVRAYYSLARSIREIAALGGKTENSVYKTLRRIRAKLAICIQQRLGLGHE